MLNLKPPSSDLISHDEVQIFRTKFISDTHSIQVDQAMLKFPSISNTVLQLKNTLAPINRLPPEILTPILTLPGSERNLINSTAVCKYWRRTLVSTPNLWKNILCSRDAEWHTISPHVNAYFERSGSFPVVVQIPARDSRLLSPHTDRISGLTLFIGTQTDLTQIARHLSKPAPLLESINLHTSLEDHRGLVLPPGFYQNFLSSATTLNISGAVLSPGPCQLSKLTAFTLNTLVTFPASNTLLDILEQMPFLQVFKTTLRRTYLWDPIPWDRVVTLPRLEQITIITEEARPSPVPNQILLALRLPSARRVLLLSTYASCAPQIPILPLSFEYQLPHFTLTPNASAAFDPGSNTIRFLGSDGSELTVRITLSKIHPFVRSVFGGTPFNSVRQLSLFFRSSSFTVDTLFFIWLIRSMEGLQSLRMEQNTAGPLTWWIKYPRQVEICPALTSLIVLDLDFDAAKQCVEQLKGIRERAGVPIAEVEVRYQKVCVTDDDLHFSF